MPVGRETEVLGENLPQWLCPQILHYPSRLFEHFVGICVFSCESQTLLHSLCCLRLPITCCGVVGRSRIRISAPRLTTLKFPWNVCSSGRNLLEHLHGISRLKIWRPLPVFILLFGILAMKTCTSWLFNKKKFLPCEISGCRMFLRNLIASTRLHGSTSQKIVILCDFGIA
jgi:hypothetical protein